MADSHDLGWLTLVDVARARAREQGDLGVFTFLEDGETDARTLSAAQLDRRARAVAAELQRVAEPGSRALLLYPPGLDYVIAFFACLYAGVIAVPAYPPDPRALARTLPRLQSILADCEASVVLTLGALAGPSASLLRGPAPLTWVATDEVADARASDWRAATLQSSDIAFLQYTSGSTDTPKGVMLSHANLLENSARIRECFGHSSASQGVIWLPPYHDMGLIGGIIQPLYAGFPVTLMSPLHFLQRPLRWLQAISRYRATTSGGPNFAYDLCVRKSTAQQRRELDLSSWDLAFNGAEPIRPQTLGRFADAFAPSGFAPTAFYPCYGLAEATLIVSGGDKGAAAITGSPRASAGHELVACGRALAGHDLVIVEPQTRRRVEPGEIGEIWVAGPSVAAGYWGREQDTARSFRATIGDHERPYLRTGDLGALDDRGELFVTGRHKDLIIIRGRNLYPQDLEATIERCDPGLRPGCGAVFTIGDEADEQLAVVYEFDVKRSERAGEQVIERIRGAVSSAHGVAPRAVVLIEPRTVPKTSSGKIQRFACRAALAERSLSAIVSWSAERVEPGQERRRAHELRAWLIDQVATRLGTSADRVDPARPLAELGLDSAEAVGLSGELEALLGRRLAPTLIYEHPSIDRLAAHLSTEPDAQAVEAATGDGPTGEPIAIVGIGCRFPGADGPSAFWQLLREGVDAITEVSPAREQLCGQFEAAARFGGFLDDVAGFDADLFAITPREAAAMDPQQRLLLEQTWLALEDAGQRVEDLRGSSTGVFVGICNSDYGRDVAAADEPYGPYGATGNAISIAANRVSYAFDLRGPSLAIDTACSSSLVAVHLACRSLWSGESQQAIAAGVNLVLAPALSHNLARAGFLAADGRCRAFAADAGGYVRGEGCGVILLEPLSRARALGRRIYAVIRGSAVNSDGRSNGLTAPSVSAQAAVLRAAHQHAGVAGHELGYVEAHGTGTVLGDPIEVTALARVLGSQTECVLGSVKTNIGHLEGAAGIAGLIKTALALHHAELPPSLHADPPNPHIDFDAARLRVARGREAWPGSRLAGVSSFGFGGTNAHVVLEQAPVVEPAVALELGEGPVLLAISAHTPAALRELASRYVDRLEGSPAPLAAIARAAALQRSGLDERAAVVGSSASELIAGLRSYASAAVPGRRPMNGSARCVFVFSGQGDQWWGMGRELLERSPEFRADYDRCDQALAPMLGWSVFDALTVEASAAKLGESGVIQPVLFALQVALAQQWRRYGIEPDAVVGHSLGELAAAHVAGVLSLSDAAALVVARARVTERVAGLAKLAVVAIGPEQLRVQLDAAGLEGLEIVAHNGPEQTVVCGPASSLARLPGARVLDHEYPFHSAHMQPSADELGRALRESGLRSQRGSVPIISTVTGAELDGSQFNADYWGSQLRAPVQFAAAISSLIDGGHRHFIEIGAHPVLSRSILSSLGAREGLVVHSLRRGVDARASMLGALAQLFVCGHAPSWSAVWPGQAQTVALPHLALQRRPAWHARTSRRSQARTSAHPLLGSRVELGHRSGAQVWEAAISLAHAPELADHRFEGAAILPATAYLEMALAAAIERRGAGLDAGPIALRNVEILAPLMVPDGSPRAVQLALTDGQRFEIHSRAPDHDGATWVLHARGEVQADLEPEADLGEPPSLPAEPRVTAEAHYQQLRARGLDYGPAFRGVQQISRRDDVAIAQLRAPTSVASDSRYHVHPALLDAAAQVVAALGGDEGRPFLPVGVALIRFVHRPGASAWSLARTHSETERERTVHLELRDDEGRLQVDVQGLRLRYLDLASAGARGREDLDDLLYQLEWRPSRLRALPRAQPPGVWLVLCDRGGFGDALISELTAVGDCCVRVEPGAAFTRVSADHYRIDATRAEDMHALFEHLRERGDPCRGVVHAWSLAARPDHEQGEHHDLDAEVAALETSLNLDVGVTVHVLRELVGQRWPSPPKLWLVSRGAAPVRDDEPTTTAGATLWGLGRTLAQEHPGVFGGLVDVDPQAAPEAQVHALIRELRAPDGEVQIAYRDAQRHVVRVTRARVPATPDTNAELRCRVDGCYLITGGLGGLGLHVARELVDRGARRLVLMGRSALPERHTWAAVDPATRVGGQIAAIQAFEREGVSVHLAAVDVGDPAQVQEFLQQHRSEGWPPIRGVVHLAGVLQDQILLRLDAAMLAAVFRAKVIGAWVLHRALERHDLDLFVLFSSVAAVLGSAGQGNYAAANSFLDALARDRRARGLVAHSLDWGPWADVGVARDDRRLARRGIESLAPERALGLMRTLLAPARASAWTQITVMDVDWARFARAHPTLSASPPIAELVTAELAAHRQAPAPERGAAAAAILALPVAERAPRIVALLTAHIALAVGRAEQALAADRPMVELGLDSLMGIELRARLEAELGVELPMATLLEGPSIHDLADDLLARLSSTPAARQPTGRAARRTYLRERPGLPTLTLIHPGALDIDGYASFATALDCHGVEVIELPELEAGGASELEATIDILADRCVDLIIGSQAVPRVLGGWSLGGVLAYETAARLRERGHAPELVALLDSPTPHVGSDATNYADPALVASFASYLGARATISTPPPTLDRARPRADQLEHVRAWAVEHAGLPPSTDAEQIQALFQIYVSGLQRSVRRLAGYQPRLYAGPVVYLRAVDTLRAFAEVFPDSVEVWRELCVGLSVRDVPGDHYSMFAAAHGPALAAALRACLS
ncbi:type I polyketide synthase [Enhygromyxa salina]|uniref:Phthiocerol/phenolphthiocerol synthesis polyketide synthase type I PpsA n=1 Tax=Enhygromyxa salina TaxID=215803 RepID=A0A2S9YV78_9BACT|nr:type I polyketide synthase [Enhygromyxa salina]PRQ08993.1 Phthiocerol/phenolphthiocerol synthesis polyketide synthase type I PpsA [Enhygromyxa salina]